MNVVTLTRVSKTYRLDAVEVPALAEVDLAIRPDRFTVISGASGSGKTTLLNVIGCIDLPDQGEVVVAGQAVRSLQDDALSDFRAAHIGFIFQNFNLLPVLTVYENVEYPLLLGRVAAAERRRRVEELLEAVGLAARARHYPGQLSGGQQQRIAVARAIVARPAVVLADEPTANLDSHTASDLLRTMKTLNETRGITFLISTHDPMVMEFARRLVTLHDGRITHDQERG